MTIWIRKSLLDGLEVLDLDRLTPVAFFDGKLIGIDRFGYRMDGEVFAVDLGTGGWAQLTDDGHPKNSAAMSADYLAWTDGRRHGGGGHSGPDDIFVRDLRTGEERRITEEPASRDGLQISGSRLVWHEDRNLQERGADIYAYDLESDELLQVAVGQPASRSWPKVDGDIVVWADDRAERFHIYMHDLATGNERLLAEAWAHYPRPTIEGRLVTWEAAEGIVQLDIDTGQRRTIFDRSKYTDWPVWSEDYGSDDFVAWSVVAPVLTFPTQEKREEIGVFVYDPKKDEIRQLSDDRVAHAQLYGNVLVIEKVGHGGARRGTYAVFLE